MKNNHVEIIQGDACDLPEYATGAMLVFADPPYNVGIDYGKGSKADRVPPAVFTARLALWIDAMRQAAAPGGMIAVLISEEWADTTGRLLGEIIGPRYRRVIWREQFAQYNRNGLTREHRHLFLHRRPGGDGRWNPDPIRVPSRRMELGDKRAAGPRIPGDVWDVSRLQGTSTHRVPWHPAQLPPAPLERLVLAFTDPGDLVAEPFAGSGSMARVAALAGRRYTGVDANRDYVAQARARLAAELAEGAACG